MEKRKFVGLIKDEVRSLTKNGIIIFNACCIFVLVILIGLIYQKGVLDRITMVIADLDQTGTSRNITQQFAESEKFSVTQVLDDTAAMKAVRSGEVAAAVILPPGLSQEIKRGQGSDVLLVIDGTNYIVANTAYAKAAEILQTINGGVALKTLEGRGILPAEAAKLVQTVRLEQKILYNPDYNYAYYLSYGVFTAGIFSLLMSGVAITLARDRQKKAITLGEMSAKFVVYGSFAAIVTNMVFAAAHLIFGLPGEGDPLNFLLLTIPFGGLIAAFAILLLVLAVDEVRVFQAVVFFATPLFFITGYTWPLQSIPAILTPLYYLCPLTPFVDGVRAALVMGATFPAAFKYTLWEAILLIVYLPLAGLLYKKKFRV